MLTLLRIDSVVALTGLARPTIYKRIKQNLFTVGVKIGKRSVAWPKHEVDAINAALIAGKDESQIAQLVEQLHNQRKVN